MSNEQERAEIAMEVARALRSLDRLMGSGVIRFARMIVVTREGKMMALGRGDPDYVTVVPDIPG